MRAVTLYFENTTPPHKKFYRLALQPSLFYVHVRRDWGRLGSWTRTKEEMFDDWQEADRALRRYVNRRLRHGYLLKKCFLDYVAWKPASVVSTANDSSPRRVTTVHSQVSDPDHQLARIKEATAALKAEAKAKAEEEHKIGPGDHSDPPANSAVPSDKLPARLVAC